MPGALPETAVESFRDDGFWFPFRLMPREQALAIGERFMAFAQGDVAARYSEPQNQLTF